MNDAYQIRLREIQNYIYCKRRWWLTYVENEWRGNDKTAAGDITHSAVNDPFFSETRGNRFVSRAVPVFSEAYNLAGVADCLEFTRDDGGVQVDGRAGRYAISVVEYKNAKPKFFERAELADTMQLAAQALCAEEMFGTRPAAYLYFADVKRRFKTEITEAVVQELLKTLAEIRSSLDGGAPGIPRGQRCSNCSMWDYCLPKSKAKQPSVFERVKKLNDTAE